MHWTFLETNWLNCLVCAGLISWPDFSKKLLNFFFYSEKWYFSQSFLDVRILLIENKASADVREIDSQELTRRWAEHRKREVTNLLGKYDP